MSKLRKRMFIGNGNSSHDGSFQDYLRLISKKPILPPEEQRRLLEALHEERELGNTAEVNRLRALLVESNLRLVIYVAKRYVDPRAGFELSELIAAGNEGLVKAVDHYDVMRFDVALNTYAVHYINQAITTHVSNNQLHTRAPYNLMTLYRHYLAGRLLNADLSPSQLRAMKQLGLFHRKNSSLNDVLSDDEDERTLIDLIQSEPDALSYEDQLFKEQLRSLLEERLAELKPNQRQAILYRYGFTELGPMTLEDASERMGLTRERVRQLEVEALRALRWHADLKLLAEV